MKDINNEFDKILIEYGIIEDVTLKGVINAVQDLEKEFKRGKKIGLYGCGKQAEGLMVFISKYAKDLKIECCFDKTIRQYQHKDMILNGSVYSADNISDASIDYMLIGSYKFRGELAKKLHDIGFQGKIVDLYDYLGEYIDEHFSDYEIIFNLKQEYNKATVERKEVLLQQLIKQYLMIKDFVSAFDLIDFYCKQKYSYYIRYFNLEKRLKEMLDDILNYINCRNQKDIIWNWIDALSYYEMDKFPFLKKEAEKSVNFKNTYTVIPWTTDITKAMLFGEYPIEGKLFLHKTLNSKDIKLTQILTEYGYDFVYCGMPKFAKLFDASVIVPSNYYESKFSSSLQKQWDALAMICMNEKPMCILIHTLFETHEPYICGEGDTFIRFRSSRKDWEKEICRKQAEIAGNYIDRRLAFYKQFYGCNSIKIYMSDHGRVGNLPMDEKKIHTILTISGNFINKKEVEGIFSLVKFPDLVKKIIKGEHNWEELTDYYAVVENFDAYAESTVNRTLIGDFSREEMCQCRGIVTKKDKYFLYAHGKEYYFSNPLSEENEIDNPLYTERIKQLRKLCSNEFIDIYQYEKFKYSRLLYSESDQQ